MKTQSQILNLFLITALTLLFEYVKAQPNTEWSKSIGASGDDSNSFGKITALKDGNYLLVGETNSTDGIFASAGNKGDMDAFVIKFKSNGDVIWAKTYGGSADDIFNSVVESPDHTLMLGGATYSNDGDVNGNHGDQDAWVVKLSATGTLLSQRCFGGSGEDRITEMTGIDGSHYAFAGWSLSTDGDITDNHGGNDAWVVLLNKQISKIWSKTFGGSSDEIAVSVMTAHGKIIISGFTASDDGDMNGYHGGDWDVFATAINGSGSVVWSKCYGGSDADYSGFHSGKSKDGNLLISGSTYSNDGDVSGNNGGADMWVLKVNSINGSLAWSRCFGTSLYEFSYGIATLTNGDMIALGITDPNDELFGSSNSDAQAFGIDKDGNYLWNQTFGGSDYDELEYGVSTGDGGTILLGNTTSTDGDIGDNHGGIDCWLVKLNDVGLVQRQQPTTESNTSLQVYPNPVSLSNPPAISFTLSSLQNISLQIFDASGRLIRTLANEQMSEGDHALTWNVHDENGNNVSEGIYFLRMQTENEVKTISISVIK